MSNAKKITPNIIQKRQALNAYAPVVRSRRNSLSPFDLQLMHDAFLVNEECEWELTSNCKIVKAGENFMVRLLRRGRALDKNGKRMASSKHDNTVDAEDIAFKFCYNLESKGCQEILDVYISNLKLKLKGCTTSIPINNSENVAAVKESPPLKRMRSLPRALTKSYSMSGSVQLNLKANTSNNPMNCPSNSSSLLDPMTSSLLTKYAKTIQCAVRNKEARRAAKWVKNTMVDQAYRKRVTTYLSNHIRNDRCVSDYSV